MQNPAPLLVVIKKEILMSYTREPELVRESNNLSEVKPIAQLVGSIGLLQHTPGPQSLLSKLLESSSDIGNPSLGKEPASSTGLQLSETAVSKLSDGAVAIWNAQPATALEAQQRVKLLTEDLLPRCVQAWLRDKAEAVLMAPSIGRLKEIPTPVLHADDRAQLMGVLTSLTDLLAPSSLRGAELEVEVGKLFAAFNIFTGDAGKLRAQLMVWCEELEDFPLWAVRMAYKSWVRGGSKMPSLADFIESVKFAIGSDVYARKRAIEGLLATR